MWSKAPPGDGWGRVVRKQVMPHTPSLQLPSRHTHHRRSLTPKARLRWPLHSLRLLLCYIDIQLFSPFPLFFPSLVSSFLSILYFPHSFLPSFPVSYSIRSFPHSFSFFLPFYFFLSTFSTCLLSLPLFPNFPIFILPHLSFPPSNPASLPHFFTSLPYPRASCNISSLCLECR